MWKTKTATISIVVGALEVNIKKGTEKQFSVINQIAGHLGNNSHSNSTHSQNINFHQVISRYDPALVRRPKVIRKRQRAGDERAKTAVFRSGKTVPLNMMNVKADTIFLFVQFILNMRGNSDSHNNLVSFPSVEQVYPSS